MGAYTKMGAYSRVYGTYNVYHILSHTVHMTVYQTYEYP